MSQAEEALELEAAAAAFSSDADVKVLFKRAFRQELRLRKLEGGHGGHSFRPADFAATLEP